MTTVASDSVYEVHALAPAYDAVALARLVSDRLLHLIILPTEKCNFRCTYCYEDFAIGRMSNETMVGVKALLNRRAAELDYLYLSWFGGEPLLAKGVILDISAYAAALAARYPRLTYRGGATTNAYLLDRSTLSALCRVGVLDYQISLDGPRELHNRSRRRADAAGTYDRIWQNLLALRDGSEAVSVVLRLHFDAETVSQMDPLLDDIRREFLPDRRFTVFFKAIARLGGPHDAAIKVLSPAAEQAALGKLRRKLYGEGFVAPEEPPYVCYASRPNSLVIRANGSVAKCTVALADPRNRIGTLKPDGTLEINSGRLGLWLRGLTTLDAATLECPLNGLPGEAR